MRKNYKAFRASPVLLHAVVLRKDSLPSRKPAFVYPADSFGFSYPEIRDAEALPAFQNIDKKERWKRKLLELTARSPLLNIPLTGEGKKNLFLLSANLEKLYEKVKTGQAFRVAGSPKNYIPSAKGEDPFERLADIRPLGEELLSQMEKGILHADCGEDAAAKTLSSIRRAETELKNQSGVGALYLALGMLKWQDERKKKFFYAPLLLIPMQFIREGKVLRISYTGDRIRFNETVLEHLRNRYEIRPAGLSPVPEGEDGHPNLGAIFAYLKYAVREEASLSLFSHACLGMFQFGRYVMWKDLYDHMEVYEKHPLIAGLLSNVLPESVNKNASFWPYEEILLPLPADATQLHAVSAALGENSYVMHGPPGTGKSQTIAIIIANLMAQGKSVLFAAEKEAALRVVYNRLSQIGIADFCLYLPAVNRKKSDKELFLQQLRLALSKAREGWDTGYSALKKELDEKSGEIKRQVRLLHGVRICGFTAYNLMSEYLMLESFRPDFPLAESFVDTLTREQLPVYERELKQLALSGKNAGHPHSHPLRDWGPYAYQVAMQQKIRPQLEDYQKCLTAAVRSVRALGETIGKPLNSTKDGLSELSLLRENLSLLEQVPGELFGLEHPFQALKLYIHTKRYQEQKEFLLTQCQEEFMKLPLQEKYQEWCSLSYDTGLKAKVKRQSFRNQLLPLLKGKDWTDEKLTIFLNYSSQFQKIPLPPAKVLPLSLTLKQAEGLEARLKSLFPKEEDFKEFGRIRWNEETKIRIQRLPETIRLLEALSRRIEDTFHISMPLWHQGKQDLSEALSCVSRWLDGLDVLREWSEYQKSRESCLSYGLAPFVDLLEDGMDPDELLPSFRAAVYYALMNRVYERNTDVREFAGYRFTKLIEHYKELNDKFCRISAVEIQMRLSRRVQNALAMGDANLQKEITFLKRMLESNGKGMSIRSIVERLPNILKILTPCRILSPMTAAQYLSPVPAQADVLIFDEASQLETARAIGLIARAKQVIIAGDPSQMPPTSFFDVAVEDDSVDAFDEDQESVLKDFLALSLPSYYLQWHYRSRHESLISFSNNRYYGGRMVTFPSADNRICRVKFTKVNGIYDRGHSMTNRIEAAVCVNYLKQQLLSGDTRSYGIITFNERQRSLIERLLEKETASHPEFDRALLEMEEREEPLFVRNLESVQGDERDVILFSLGYGPDKEGKIIMAFGPLALPGGYRRLNVAITRSRDEMILFSSLEPEEMHTTAFTSRAVRDLKDFLTFARDNSQLLKGSEAESPEEDGFRRKILQFLEREGYQYDENVGNSRLRVDIGVLDPDDPGRYCLGLVLNSNRYYENPSIYDREIGQFEVLKARGWRLLRIWSIDWWDDPLREQNRILKNLPVISHTQKEVPQNE